MPFLEITGLSKSFKNQEVIRDLSLEVEKGEFLVIFGPSGCGKTVLLRLIAGMMQPDFWRHRHRRPICHRCESRAPGRRHGVPELCALPPHDRV